MDAWTALARAGGVNADLDTALAVADHGDPGEALVSEEGAIEQYQKIIELCGDDDPVTQDIITGIKGDEEEHRRLFKGFLREAESMRL